jgi:2Fe-2S ferredoxin
MPIANFLAADGSRYAVDVDTGYSLMEGARQAGVPGIRAECGGACACATCHVRVAQAWRGLVGPATPAEAEMLDFADGVTEASRLSCQIIMRPDLDGITVEVAED